MVNGVEDKYIQSLITSFNSVIPSYWLSVGWLCLWLKINWGHITEKKEQRWDKTKKKEAVKPQWMTSIDLWSLLYWINIDYPIIYICHITPHSPTVNFLLYHFSSSPFFLSYYNNIPYNVFRYSCMITTLLIWFQRCYQDSKGKLSFIVMQVVVCMCEKLHKNKLTQKIPQKVWKKKL